MCANTLAGCVINLSNRDIWSVSTDRKMSFVTILVLSFSLAMDAFAVSIASGLSMSTPSGLKAIRIALFFGFFQFAMPIVGWVAGVGLSYIISGFDHWIAFGLLTFIGCRMIYESRKVESKGIDAASLFSLLVLSVATSIDALGVGVSLPFMEVSLLPTVVTIGVITFLLSLTGVYMGLKIGHLFKKVIEVLGGVVLILIGIRILTQHLIGIGT